MVACPSKALPVAYSSLHLRKACSQVVQGVEPDKQGLCRQHRSSLLSDVRALLVASWHGRGRTRPANTQALRRDHSSAWQPSISWFMLTPQAQPDARSGQLQGESAFDVFDFGNPRKRMLQGSWLASLSTTLVPGCQLCPASIRSVLIARCPCTEKQRSTHTQSSGTDISGL